MAIESLSLGRKIVLVGIRLDSHAKELLDWGLVKVANKGDGVVAIHVCRNSESISKEKKVLDGYLEDYEGLCDQNQVTLTADVVNGNSVRKVLVGVAMNLSASAVIVGINKHRAFGGWGSIAKYCVKKLPPTTEVVAIYNGKVVFSRFSKLLFEDPNPSFYLNDNLTFKDNQSEFEESEISEMSGLSNDGRDGLSSRGGDRRQSKGSLSAISLPVEDFTKQRPGWPLQQTASSMTQLALEARKLSVVQWVMTLPHRTLPDFSISNLLTSHGTEDSVERENGKPTEWKDLPKELQIILMKSSAGCAIFSREFLKLSTSDFSSGNLVGEGGCNSVYKGLLPEGEVVAVKVSKSSDEAWKDFIMEVDIITSLKHKRIAPLLGICIENNDLITVYDYMPKGSLAENLHGNRKEHSVLSWETRFQIALGIAEALTYLHNECPRPVIHRDIKSSNILLTDELKPQLCDFGLAIWGPTTGSFLIDSDVAGTFGYLAPEYFMHGKLSVKVDVYAFGVVLLELLSGMEAIGSETTRGQESLVMSAKPRLACMDFRSMLDPNLDGKVDEAEMQRMVKAAALCLAQAARLRPKMCEILSILRGEENENPGSCDVSENPDDDEDDDEVYPDSSVESHMSLAFLDLKDNCASFSSTDLSSPRSVEEYLKKRWE